MCNSCLQLKIDQYFITPCWAPTLRGIDDPLPTPGFSLTFSNLE